VRGENITEEIKVWLTTHKVTYPFDEDTQTQFILTFGGR